VERPLRICLRPHFASRSDAGFRVRHVLGRRRNAATSRGGKEDNWEREPFVYSHRLTSPWGGEAAEKLVPSIQDKLHFTRARAILQA
jgi:hypothetical protein